MHFPKEPNHDMFEMIWLCLLKFPYKLNRFRNKKPSTNQLGHRLWLGEKR